MARYSKVNRKRAKAQKKKNRAKKLAANRALDFQIEMAKRTIEKGEREGFVFSGTDIRNMSRSQVKQLLKTNAKALNPSHIRANQYFGIKGVNEEGARGRSNVLISTGIRRSQVNKNNPYILQLAQRFNRSAQFIIDEYTREPDSNKRRVSTSEDRSIRQSMRLKNLANLGIVDMAGIDRRNVYNARIDVGKLREAWFEADETERNRLLTILEGLNIEPEMSVEQYQFWRASRVLKEEELGIGHGMIELARNFMGTTGLWEGIKARDYDSEQKREVARIDAYIKTHQAEWKGDFRDKLERALLNEDFDKAKELVIQQGFRTKVAF